MSIEKSETVFSPFFPRPDCAPGPTPEEFTMRIIGDDGGLVRFAIDATDAKAAAEGESRREPFSR